MTDSRATENGGYIATTLSTCVLPVRCLATLLGTRVLPAERLATLLRTRVMPAGRLAAVLGLFVLLAGCLATLPITDTLPEEVEDRIEPLEDAPGVSLRFMPTADAQRIEVNLGRVDLSMNRLFSGMLHEMAQRKFGRVDASAANELVVAISYLNLEERQYSGAVVIHRVEMEVLVDVREGGNAARREFLHAAEADVEGYSVRSDQIYDLLLHFITSIDAFTDAHFR